MNKKTTARRTTKRKKRTTRKTAARNAAPAVSGRKYELVGLVLFALGLISLLGLFGLSVGPFGTYFAKVLHYMFGVGAVVVTLLIMLIGYQYMSHHHGLHYSVRFFGIAALFIVLLAIWHHFVIPVGAEVMPDSLPRGGGLLGGSLLFGLRKIFGVDGTIIVLGISFIGSILLSTSWSLARGLNKTEEKVAKGADVTGSVLTAAYDKMAEAGERAEEHVVSSVKARVKRRAAYNQERDGSVDDPAETASAEPADERISPTGSAAGVGAVADISHDRVMGEVLRRAEEDAAEEAGDDFQADTGADAPTPQFTIEYSREPAATTSAAPAATVSSAPVPTPAPAPTAAAGEGAAEPVQPAVPPYVLPQVTEILDKHVKKHDDALEIEIQEKAGHLAKMLNDFRVKAHIINACHGPAVTRYDLEPAPGVKVSKITGLAEDIALSLAAPSVRIEPIPGKAAIGIEVPNDKLEGVPLRDVLDNDRFYKAKSKLTVGLGMDISGQAIFADLAKMPHLLVAGTTGSGKSVCINSLITSILFKAKPDEVKFILIDPKMVELSNYNGIPHLMVPVVTEAKKAASVLNWAVQEMEKRYAKFAETGVRKMESFNHKFPEEKMPSIVIIIDELADLMMVAPHDVEDAICRLAQKARAAGIHMVLATQRPSVNVITGIIKANIPSRIAFAVGSQVDSRTILDHGGAEKLLGKGDMLFAPVGSTKPTRVQGAFVSDDEVERLLDFIRAQGQKAEANEEIIKFTEQAMAESEAESEEKGSHRSPARDELLPEAVELVMSTGQASASSLQRRFRVGYTRAARLIDTMEELHIIGPSAGGNKPREILMSSDEAMAALGAQN